MGKTPQKQALAFIKITILAWIKVPLPFVKVNIQCNDKVANTDIFS